MLSAVTADIYAYDVNFSGIAAHVRSAPSLNAQVLYQIAGNTRVSFDGWITGNEVKDYWTGKADNRWFFFFNANQEKLYIASAEIKGNPPPAPGDATSNWC